ncbi:Legumain [Trichoplax sp. H2]|nr:Legumain [Trichoplax sp. H2]|eukprot:RDD40921.1 Legumain [Trichoplax sp. H2]
MWKLTVIVVMTCLTGLLLALPSLHSREDDGKNWAVLVAGSNGWDNYRHQADICHAYQILHKNGFPDERIVVMMYDDIAENENNPTPGKIINRPYGPNVYANVLKDYTKNHVNPTNFINVLLGNADKVTGGSGKVLKSGPNDRVFINFVDHGAQGLVAFPEDILTAKMLNQTINQMYMKKMFKQLVIYVEACEAGSMFHNVLADNKNVYVTTASDPTHSSYACYYDKKRGTYLGDVYSINWMQNSDQADMQTETLIQQFDTVRRKTNTSKVCKYGDMSFDEEDLDNFQGDPKSNTPSKLFDPYPLPPMDTVAAPDVPVVILSNRITDATSKTERQHYIGQLEKLIEHREKIDKTIRSILIEAVENNFELAHHIMHHQKHDIKNFDCLHVMTKSFSEKCYNLGKNDYAMRMVYVLVNLCETERMTESMILSAINKICH